MASRVVVLVMVDVSNSISVFRQRFEGGPPHISHRAVKKTTKWSVLLGLDSLTIGPMQWSRIFVLDGSEKKKNGHLKSNLPLVNISWQIKQQMVKKKRS